MHKFFDLDPEGDTYDYMLEFVQGPIKLIFVVHLTGTSQKEIDLLQGPKASLRTACKCGHCDKVSIWKEGDHVQLDFDSNALFSIELPYDSSLHETLTLIKDQSIKPDAYEGYVAHTC